MATPDDVRAIFHVYHDGFLLAIYPNLAREVYKWMRWHKDPQDSPPIPTEVLVAACIQVIATWPVMYRDME